MPDLDELLDAGGDVGRRAAGASRLPDFGVIEARGRRKRRVRGGLIVGAVGLSVACVIGVVQVVSGSTNAGPTPGPATHSPSEVIDAERVVDARGARVVQLAEDPDDPSARAVVWESGREGKQAIALTGDDFATRKVMEAPGPVEHLEAVGNGQYLTSGLREVWLIDEDEVTRVHTNQKVRPVQDDEVAIPYGNKNLVAFDPKTESAHQVPVPRGVLGIDSVGGRLYAADHSTRRNGIHYWSDDGGSTWDRMEPRVDGSNLVGMVGAGLGEPVLLNEIGDGGTIGPTEAIQRLDEGGQLVRTPVPGKVSGVAEFVWEGRLRTMAHQNPADASDGLVLYELNGDRFSRVSVDIPGDGDLLWTVNPYYVNGRPVVWATAEGNVGYRSDDGGETWAKVRVR